MRLRILPLLGATGLLCLSASLALAAPDGLRARISTGDCSMPGQLVAELTGAAAADGPWPSAMQLVVEALGVTEGASRTTVPIALGDLASSGHALSILDADGVTLACGELGAFEPEPNDLQLGLARIDDASVGGVAWLHDNGDGTTIVSVVLGPPPITDSTAAVTTSIERSLYVPNPLEVPVGTTVTWVNEDALPHTTTAADGSFDSAYMAKGDTWSHTFDAPGTYPIYCIFHPRMRATVIVD